MILFTYCGENVHSSRSKDFRPSYGRLSELRAFVPEGTPFMACTATATLSVRSDITTSLEFTDDYQVIAHSPDRPNIFYEVKSALFLTCRRLRVLAKRASLTET